MAGIINICAVCAWRATCQKKFSVSGRSMHCPDFVRDVTIIEEPSENLGEKEEKKEDERREA
ncbi:MAG: hypothetical protein ACK415_00255 [Thermodesulfovibrionales bacterium]